MRSTGGRLGVPGQLKEARERKNIAVGELQRRKGEGGQDLQPDEFFGTFPFPIAGDDHSLRLRQGNLDGKTSVRHRLAGQGSWRELLHEANRILLIL